MAKKKPKKIRPTQSPADISRNRERRNRGANGTDIHDINGQPKKSPPFPRKRKR